MNTHKIHFLAIALLCMVAMTPLTSCKKYEDGPYLSLRSKTERVANTWKVEKSTNGGKDNTSDYSDFRVTFTKSGDYSSVSPVGFFDISTKGTWSFANDKEDIQVVTDPTLGLSATKTYHILKLTESHLWVRSGDTELHLIPA